MAKMTINLTADFGDFVKAEEEILEAKVKGIRVINHPGEKGRAVEYEVMELLRSFLPAEYGLSTGFVAYHSSTKNMSKIELSTQLDIIIYDALRSGPIINLGICNVFPIEAVYGFVECKMSVNRKAIKACIEQSKRLRQVSVRIYRKNDGVNTTARKPIPNFMPIRSYLFVADIGKLPRKTKTICDVFNKYSRDVGEDNIIHAIYIGNSGLYRQKQNRDYEATVVQPLLTFKNEMLVGLSRFPRIPADCTPDLGSYFGGGNLRGEPYREIISFSDDVDSKYAATGPVACNIFNGQAYKDNKK